MIPYSTQSIDEDDIKAVAEALRRPLLTTGELVDAFESAFAATTGATHAVALSSGTAALHAAIHALGLGPGDEVIIPALTFVASANCVLYQGAHPVICDVDPDTLLLTAKTVEKCITPNTRAIITVDYAGQPCDYKALRQLADHHGIKLVADACHSLGASYAGHPVGTLADITAFSLHPLKAITTGEGGMITTASEALAERVRRFRSHGINRDHRRRERQESFDYDMIELGYNYRLTDIQCALGLSQLPKLAPHLSARERIADRYNQALDDKSRFRPLVCGENRTHAHHLYVIKFEASEARDAMFRHLRSAGIGTAVHYPPVHLHSYYKEHLGTQAGQQPIAEHAYRHILSLPIHPRLTEQQQDLVISHLQGTR